MTPQEKKENIELVMARNGAGENFCSSIGLVYDKLDDTVAEGHFVAVKRLCNPLGIVHGGVYFTLMDQLAGMMAAVSGQVGVTLEGNINYLKSAREGSLVRCRMEAVHVGRSTALFEGKCYDDRGVLQCTGSFQLFFLGKLGDVVK